MADIPNQPAESPPVVEVAVVIIEREGKVLAVYNPRWGLFTLPMTKRRVWGDQVILGGYSEPWREAAERAAVETLKRTLPPNTLTPARPCASAETDGRLPDAKEIIEHRAIDFAASGIYPSLGEPQFKLYKFRLFKMRMNTDCNLPDDLIHEWLAPRDFRRRQGVSPTAQHIIAEALGREFILPGTKPSGATRPKVLNSAGN